MNNIGGTIRIQLDIKFSKRELADLMTIYRNWKSVEDDKDIWITYHERYLLLKLINQIEITSGLGDVN